MDHLEENPVDWDKGLPPDVLALVAKAGGLEAMKQMRGVSSQWQEGFELGVNRIKVFLKGPLLPRGGKAALRFPMLSSLDLGDSATDEAWLESLHAVCKLGSLVLGKDEELLWVDITKKLGGRLTDAGVQHLRGLALTNLHLGVFRGTDELTDVSLEALAGMPFTSLDLSWCSALTADGLQLLRDMPLRRLVLKECSTFLSEGGPEQLRGLPLTSLDLTRAGTEDASEDRCEVLSDGFRALKGMPLTEQIGVFG